MLESCGCKIAVSIKAYALPSQAAGSRTTGLEFHDEVVCEDGNLLNELFDQSLIELCDIGFLPGNEVLQFQESILNVVRRERVSVDHGLGDVLL